MNVNIDRITIESALWEVLVINLGKDINSFYNGEDYSEVEYYNFIVGLMNTTDNMLTPEERLNYIGLGHNTIAILESKLKDLVLEKLGSRKANYEILNAVDFILKDSILLKRDYIEGLKKHVWALDIEAIVRLYKQIRVITFSSDGSVKYKGESNLERDGLVGETNKGFEVLKSLSNETFFKTYDKLVDLTKLTINRFYFDTNTYDLKYFYLSFQVKLEDLVETSCMGNINFYGLDLDDRRERLKTILSENKESMTMVHVNQLLVQMMKLSDEIEEYDLTYVARELSYILFELALNSPMSEVMDMDYLWNCFFTGNMDYLKLNEEKIIEDFLSN